MKTAEVILISLSIMFLAINASSQNLVRELHQSTQNLSHEQRALVNKTLQLFPNRTQFSVAIIDDQEVFFLGVERKGDSCYQVDNASKVFEIGSITKVFTASLLAKLVEEGQLELDDSIQRFLDFKLAINHPISLKSLANHTSGLPRLPSNLNLFFADPSNPYKDYGEDELVDYLKKKIQLKAKPGLQYEYSNLGAGLLGYVLSKRMKMTYEALLHQQICAPLGMELTTTDRERLSAELISGLDAAGKETDNWDMNVLVGAGGILSTVKDLAKFASAQFDSNQVAFEQSQMPTFKISDQQQIGLGWTILDPVFQSDEIIWHNGGTGGYTSSMVLDVNNRKGVIVLSNVSAFHKESTQIDHLSLNLLKTID